MSREKKIDEGFVQEGHPVEKVGFEENLRRLEEIVAALEHGQLTLEESMAYFEEGMKLSGLCQEKLQEAQSKIEVLLNRPDGQRAWGAASPELNQMLDQGEAK